MDSAQSSISSIQSSMSSIQSFTYMAPDDFLRRFNTRTIDSLILSAIRMCHHPEAKEHHTAEYVMPLLITAFPCGPWSILPQFYTEAGKFPDIAIRKFTGEIGERAMVSKAFIEFKGPYNSSVFAAFDQVKLAITRQHLSYFGFAKKGLLISVAGTKWLFAEYNFIEVTEDHKRDVKGIRKYHTSNDVKTTYVRVYPLFADHPHANRKPGTPFPQTPDYLRKRARTVANDTSSSGDCSRHVVDVENPEEGKLVWLTLCWLSETRFKGIRDLTTNDRRHGTLIQSGSSYSLYDYLSDNRAGSHDGKKITAMFDREEDEEPGKDTEEEQQASVGAARREGTESSLGDLVARTNALRDNLGE